MDSGDLIPVLGIAMLAGTTVFSIVGAYALGRVKRREERISLPDRELAERIERVEHLMETMAVEIERIGESQRFLVKVMSAKQLAPDAARPPERVITPH